MPRKAKDKIDENDEKKSTKKNTSKAKSDKTEKIATKKDKTTTTKKSTSEKKTTSTKKTASTKKATSTKKEASTKKVSSTKKSSSTARKTSSEKKSTSTKKSFKNENSIQIVEYYDLPYKYGNTIVRLLAQTPKTLFVYWEVSDNDIENFKKNYGDDFFKKTKPILVVHNLTLNKTSEIASKSHCSSK